MLLGMACGAPKAPLPKGGRQKSALRNRFLTGGIRGRQYEYAQTQCEFVVPAANPSAPSGHLPLGKGGLVLYKAKNAHGIAVGIMGIYLAASTQFLTMAFISSIFFSMSLARAIWQRVLTRLWPGYLVLK